MFGVIHTVRMKTSDHFCLTKVIGLREEQKIWESPFLRPVRSAVMQKISAKPQKGESNNGFQLIPKKSNEDR